LSATCPFGHLDRLRNRRRRGLRLGLQKAVQRRATFATQRDEWAKRECAISADLFALPNTNCWPERFRSDDLRVAG
jgi:hypothetical protein